MTKPKGLEVKIGLFAGLGLGLLLVAIWMLGTAQELFSRKQAYFLALSDAEGLVRGASVLIAGVRSGTVDDVTLDPRDRQVNVKLEIAIRSVESIRRDSVASITTHGVLGDKVVVISAGNPALPRLDPGSVIPARSKSAISGLFGPKGERLVERLDEIAMHFDELLLGLTRDGKADRLFNNLIAASSAVTTSAHLLNAQLKDLKLAEAVGNLNSLLAKADHGGGTVSGLVNDPQIYDDLKLLMGEVNRNRIVRNLVRQSVEDGRKREEEERSRQQAGSASSTD